jgi:hypothetical protein
MSKAESDLKAAAVVEDDDEPDEWQVYFLGEENTATETFLLTGTSGSSVLDAQVRLSHSHFMCQT